jgi:hydrogenase maturation protease
MRDLFQPGAVLVIGYGNELRRDDGVGPWVARELAALGLPKVRVRTLPQLVPELAAELAGARLAVFIDARLGSSQEKEVTMERLTPSGNPEIPGHWADPGALLTLASIYGRAPAAVLVSVTGQDFSLGEGLSDFAAVNARRALRLVQNVIRSGLWPAARLEEAKAKGPC